MNRLCPSCRKTIPDESKFCPECGYNIMLAETSYLPVTKEVVTDKPTKKSNALKKCLTIIVLIAVVVCGIFAYNNVLWGKDKIAFDLIVEYATSFKDPSSVRLISGTAGMSDDNKEYGFLCLSAKNGFGATTTGNYFLHPLGIKELDDDGDVYDIKLCKEREELNTKKINRALQREWN